MYIHLIYLGTIQRLVFNISLKNFVARNNETTIKPDESPEHPAGKGPLPQLSKCTIYNNIL